MGCAVGKACVAVLTSVVCAVVGALAGLTAAASAAHGSAAVARLTTSGANAIGVDPLPNRGAKPVGRPYAGPPGTPDPWTPLANQPSFSPDALLLLTDGSVLAHQYASGNWWRLRPDATGSYLDGSWSKVAPMPAGYVPLYFASAVLPSGRVIVEGGEFNLVNGQWQPDDGNLGAIYNPQTNKWAALSPPTGWQHIGDAPSAVLANGRFMLGSCCGTEEAILNANTLTWTPTGMGKADPNNEEGWTLLPDSQLLTIDSIDAPNTELYTPRSGTWASSGPTPVTLVAGQELGPQVLSPDGWALGTGATGATALYNTSRRIWSAGPSLPVIGGQQYTVADGPASILPDGNVLMGASPAGSPPTHYFVFNGTRLTQVADPPGAPNDQPYYTRMLVLPTGQVMFTGNAPGGGSEVSIYTDPSGPPPGWRPQITSVPHTPAIGSKYKLSGVQLDGLTQGAAYGDDFQDATNYPLVRITNRATGTSTYARTTGMTSLSVAPGAKSSTNFTLPASVKTGPSSLVAVANGISSAPTSVNITAAP
jgi:hypothetical protein